MAPRARPPKGGPKTLPPVPLSEDLAVDLWAFGEAHFGASAAGIVRAALRFFIDAQIAAEPATRQRFNEAKASVAKRGENVRVLEPKAASQPARPS